ncbi:uncharacterized protein LOC133196529 [Saccostrea echinata]|uniref:uncharacterized protein LOC133177901 n=1 Tax=Saccostrea echinata TaxID=191078 RepID=UPI002A8134BB|nr:uncharacterized protein LOC133177901 [Saccostrea echinata]XP_061188386.1 uncharacterized protein LOC133196529 [Saccostrea echinata]
MDTKSVLLLVILMFVNRAVGGLLSLQLCHSHCNIGEVDCLLQCPTILCEQDCTRAERRCVELCDAEHTTTQQVMTVDPNILTTKTHMHTKSTTAAPTTRETPTPSTVSGTSEIKPTPKPHRPPTTTTEVITTTEDKNGVVIIG